VHLRGGDSKLGRVVPVLTQTLSAAALLQEALDALLVRRAEYEAKALIDPSDGADRIMHDIAVSKVEDGAFQFANAAAARKNLEGTTKQPCIRNNFHQNVNQSPEPSTNQNNKKPVRIRAAADEVHNGYRLENESPPRDEEQKERAH